MQATATYLPNGLRRYDEPARQPRRRRRGKLSLPEIVEKAVQNETRAITMFRLAAEKTHGPVSSLFRRIAREGEFQLEYFYEWSHNIPGAEATQAPLTGAAHSAAVFSVEVQLAQLPNDNRIVLDFVLEQEKQQRDFYLKQRQMARGKKLRATLLDLADEENIHIDMLLEAGGYPPQPRREAEAL